MESSSTNPIGRNDARLLYLSITWWYFPEEIMLAAREDAETDRGKTIFMSLERAIPWTFRFAQVLSPSSGRGSKGNDTVSVSRHIRET